MMLIISVLRYRATVHPLKADVSRRKLKVVCGLASKSTNFPCLSHYRPMLCNWKYSCDCVPYFIHR
jgi:hypothetical protein